MEVPGVASVTEIVRQARDRCHDVENSLARFPPARALTAIPRTGGFAYRTLLRSRRQQPDGLPRTRLTPRLLGSVAFDEAVVSLMAAPERHPTRAELDRVAGELKVAAAMYEANGWLDDPAAYHRDPPALTRVQHRTGWAHGLRYERVHFTSEFEPYVGEPGRDRYLDFHTNRTASAWVLRHDDDEPRPWVICIHGFGMGHAYMDFSAFHAAHLHRDLGCNLVGPTLPLHGPRKVSWFSGDQFLTFDVMNGVHALTQAVWDIRRLRSWIRHEGGDAVGVYGVSLGAYTASLLAAFEPDLQAVIAGIPVCDFATLFATHSPPVIRERARDHGVLGGPAELVHRVVSPLALAPVVEPEARFLFAGLADRMSHPRQAHDLWEHWDHPRIRWYPGNHVGFLWSERVRGFVDEVLAERGLIRPPLTRSGSVDMDGVCLEDQATASPGSR